MFIGFINSWVLWRWMVERDFFKGYYRIFLATLFFIFLNYFVWGNNFFEALFGIYHSCWFMLPGSFLLFFLSLFDARITPNLKPGESLDLQKRLCLIATIMSTVWFVVDAFFIKDARKIYRENLALGETKNKTLKIQNETHGALQRAKKAIRELTSLQLENAALEKKTLELEQQKSTIISPKTVLTRKNNDVIK
jgi:phosphoglycerol transferase MdoB-like AlkP superfamily enzyme